MIKSETITARIQELTAQQDAAQIDADRVGEAGIQAAKNNTEESTRLFDLSDKAVLSLRRINATIEGLQIELKEAQAEEKQADIKKKIAAIDSEGIRISQKLGKAVSALADSWNAILEIKPEVVGINVEMMLPMILAEVDAVIGYGSNSARAKPLDTSIIIAVSKRLTDMYITSDKNDLQRGKY